MYNPPRPVQFGPREDPRDPCPNLAHSGGAHPLSQPLSSVQCPKLGTNRATPSPDKVGPLQYGSDQYSKQHPQVGSVEKFGCFRQSDRQSKPGCAQA